MSDYRAQFLNTVFLLAGMISFGLGFADLPHSQLMATLDFSYTALSFVLLHYLKSHREKLEVISFIALVLSFALFISVYLLATYNVMRLALFFLLTASAFFLKGRRAGRIWLGLILSSIIAIHLTPYFETGYSGLDVLVTCLYLFAFLTIFEHYEALKDAQYRREHAQKIELLQKNLDGQRLEAASLYARSLLEASLDPLVTIGKDGKITDVNASTENVTGYARTTLIGSDFSNYFTEPEKARSGYREVYEKGQVIDYPLAIRHRDGHLTEVLYNASVYHNQKGEVEGVFAAARDITERKRLEDELKRQAHTDHLTGLNNRRYFMELSEQELYRAARYGNALSLIMMDIDHFKRVNDTYGHKTGDIVLKKLAEICNETLREIDIAGRFGGEEFAILLPQTDLQEAAQVAERLRIALMNASITLESGELLQFTVSLGVTARSVENDTLDSLLSQADKALYEAKRGGRNKACVSASSSSGG